MTKHCDVVFLSCYLVPFLARAIFYASTYVEESTFSSREKSRLSCSLFIPDNGRYCALILAGSTELYWICEVPTFVRLKVWFFEKICFTDVALDTCPVNVGDAFYGPEMLHLFLQGKWKWPSPHSRFGHIQCSKRKSKTTSHYKYTPI